MANTSHRRPRLALPFTVLTGPDTVRLVAGEDFRYTLNGPGLDGWLPAWLARLDGSTLLDVALDSLPEDLRPAARQVTDRLYGERVLIDGAAADAHSAAAYCPAVAGSAAWATNAIPGNATGRSLPVLCQDRLDYGEAVRFNRQRLDAGEPWMWATTGPIGRAYVSPLFLPDAGPCLACLLNHFRRLSPAPELYDDLIAHATAGRPIPTVSFPSPAAEIVRQLIVWKVGLTSEPQAPVPLYRLHVLEVGSLEVTSHRVFVDPECPACGGRN